MSPVSSKSLSKNSVPNLLCCSTAALVAMSSCSGFKIPPVVSLINFLVASNNVWVSVIASSANSLAIWRSKPNPVIKAFSTA